MKQIMSKEQQRYGCDDKSVREIKKNRIIGHSRSERKRCKLHNEREANE